MNSVKCIGSIFSQLFDFLPVIRPWRVIVSIRPKPQLGVAMDWKTQGRDFGQTFNVVLHNGGFDFRKGCGAKVDIGTRRGRYTAFAPMESKIAVQIHTFATGTVVLSTIFSPITILKYQKFISNQSKCHFILTNFFWDFNLRLILSIHNHQDWPLARSGCSSYQRYFCSPHTYWPTHWSWKWQWQRWSIREHEY